MKRIKQHGPQHQRPARVCDELGSIVAALIGLAWVEPVTVGKRARAGSQVVQSRIRQGHAAQPTPRSNCPSAVTVSFCCRSCKRLVHFQHEPVTVKGGVVLSLVAPTVRVLRVLRPVINVKGRE